MNIATIIGNLTNEPETRMTTTGKSVCSFSVAVNRRNKGEGPDADFFRVAAWGKLGETCQKYLAKGRKVCVVGSVSVHTYTDHNGNGRASMELMAQDVEFLSPKGDNIDKESGYEKVDVGDALPY